MVTLIEKIAEHRAEQVKVASEITGPLGKSVKENAAEFLHNFRAKAGAAGSRAAGYARMYPKATVTAGAGVIAAGVGAKLLHNATRSKSMGEKFLNHFKANRAAYAGGGAAAAAAGAGAMAFRRKDK